MKRLTIYFLIFTGFFFWYLKPALSSNNLPYNIVLAPVRPIGEVSELALKNFQSEMEIQLHKYKDGFKVISTEFKEELIDGLLDRISELTYDDLETFGQQNVYDYLIISEIGKVSRFLSKTWSGTIRVLDIRTRVVITIKTKSDEGVTDLAKSLINKLYKTMCMGTISINVNTPEVIYSLKNESKILGNKTNNIEKIIGEYHLQLKKEKYRSFDTTFVLTPGAKVNINQNMIKRGAMVVYDGGPDGAHVQLNNKREKWLYKLPFEAFLPEGIYQVRASNPGYQNYSERINVPDSDDKLYRKIILQPENPLQYLVNSAIVPGWGQYKMGFKYQGPLIFLGELSFLSAGIISQYYYTDLDKQLDNLWGKYRNPIYTDQITSLKSQIVDKTDQQDQFKNLRNASFGIAVGIYVYNIIDIVILKNNTPQIKQKPFVPDDKIFDIGLNSNKQGLQISWNYYLR